MQVAPLDAAQHGRPERAVADNLQLHAAADRLGDAVRPTQRLHLQGILGLAPGEEAGFERVRGRREGRLRGWVAAGGGEGDVVAEGVGETWGRGGAFRRVRQRDRDLLAGVGVVCLGGVVGLGGDAEGLGSC